MPTMTSGQATAVAGAFDALAPDYDSVWTGTTVGRLQRRQVWRRLESMFHGGERILDLGCGTGVDAAFLARIGVRVHAIDVSPGMVRTARQRAERDGLADRVTFEVCALEQAGDMPRIGLFDGAFSDFGAINCLTDLRLVARSLAALVRPGGRLALCFMGRFCLCETVYHLLRGRPGRAFRRLRAGKTGIEAVLASGGPAFRVRYPSVTQLATALGGDFDLVSFRSIGVLVPPSYLEPWARTRQQTLDALASLDERIGGWPLVRGTGDHRLAVFVRK
ncbi:MAG: Methyltransferase type 11 [Acidobacteria bacterium]|nr:Methyltransferase type 11 [Acidobacteriota bacterium]